MKRKNLFLLTMMVMVFTTLFGVGTSAKTDYTLFNPLDLHVRILDPTDPFQNPHRNPVEIPEVDLYDYTLTFYTSCLGSTLRLVNVEDEVVYTTVITSDTLVLPSSLEGEYELQIVQGEWCFYGWIEL